VPAVAIAARQRSSALDFSAESDPIYAAIEKFRHADEVAMATYIYEDHLKDGHPALTPAPDDHRTPAMVAAVTAELDARLPTTKVHQDSGISIRR
jgi:hypothetical protein